MRRIGLLGILLIAPVLFLALLDHGPEPQRSRPRILFGHHEGAMERLAARVPERFEAVRNRHHGLAEEDEAGEFPNDWFYRQRAYPGTSIDPAARNLALEQARAMRDQRNPAGLRDLGDWAQAGPLNIGGRVTAIAAHPQVPGRIFAGAADGGVFRSLDSGTTWTPVFDAAGNLSIGALAIDPSNPDVVYAGTGEANASGDSFAGIGIFRSTDAGDTWDLLGLEQSRHIGRIAVDPTDPQRIYVAALGALFSKNPDRGLYRTTDGGASWDRVLFVSDSTGAVDVTIDPTQPSRIYAATWERLRTPDNRRAGGVTSGIYRSTDGGNAWTLLGGGLPAPSPTVGRIGLALAPSQPQTVYAVYADDPGYFAGLYKSTNGGDTWTRTNDGTLSDLYSNYGWYFGNVRVDPANPNRVYALGLDVYRSTNGGTTWSFISNNVHVDQHDLWIDPGQTNHMLSGGDGGFYTTTTGTSWSHAQGLPITQFYAGAIDYLNPARLYGGSQDNGTVRTPTGGLSDWQLIYGGDGFYCLVDPRNSNVIFAEYQYGGLGKSVDGGNNFVDATSGINYGDRRNWSTPVVMDPSNPDRMYYGTYRIYRSTNAGSSWSAISPDLTGGQGNGNLPYATITTIAVAPTNSQVIYAGTDDARVWRTTNGGVNWQNLSAGLPDQWVTRVAVSPGSADIAYVAQSGYRTDSPLAHLHRTADGGAHWTEIDGGLPEAPVNALALDSGLPGWIYAGTDVGVYASADGGETWGALGNGLPLDVVDDLVLHAPTRTLAAFTHGRSVYTITLPETAEVPGLAQGPLPGARLLAPYPNPLRAEGTERTRLTLEVRRGGWARLEIFDVSGRRRRTLWQEGSAAGTVASAGAGVVTREVSFDGRDDDGRRLSAGTYYARLSSASGVSTRAVTIVR